MSEGVKKKFEKKKFHRSQPKVGKSQEISAMGRLKIFCVKGKNRSGPYRVNVKDIILQLKNTTFNFLRAGSLI